MQKRIRSLLKEGEIDKVLNESHPGINLKPEHKKDLEVLTHYIYYK